MKPETVFRIKKIDPFLKGLKNVFAESIQQQSITGSSDKIICIWGRYVAMEIKKSHKNADKPTKLQQYKLDQVSRCGGLALVVSPDNWEEIKNLLSFMDETKETAWDQKTP